MKAIRVNAHGGPDVLQLEDVSEPVPGDGEVRVRLHAIGINPVETYIRSGRYARLEPLPYTPGSDGAGVIDAVGSGVAEWKAGDRVYVSGSRTGTYAEKAVCAATAIHSLPENVSFEAGASIGIPYATAHRALFHRARAVRGECVLIHGGTGGVGQAAVQLARGAGLKIAATAGSDRGLDALAKAGVEHVVDHRRADHVDAILRLTGGVDLIIEMLADVNLAADLTLLKRFGRVVVVGCRGTIEINPRDTMARDADIRGMTLFNAPPDELAAIHRDLGEGLRSGALRPVVGGTFPLAEAPRAHEALMTDGKLGKLLLIP